jgi:hypothetical protein
MEKSKENFVVLHAKLIPSDAFGKVLKKEKEEVKELKGKIMVAGRVE